MNRGSTEPSYSVHHLPMVVAPPLVVVAQVPMGVQSADVLGEGVAPAASTVAMMSSLLPRQSEERVPVGRAGVTEVAVAVA